jgi:hypothetical protein
MLQSMHCASALTANKLARLRDTFAKQRWARMQKETKRTLECFHSVSVYLDLFKHADK